MTTREQAIVELLERYHELTDPVRSGNRSGLTGVTLMPHERSCALHERGRQCTCSFRAVTELERLLALMRNRAKQEAYGGYSLGVLRFHVVAWYVDVERVASWHPIVVKRGRTRVAVGQEVLRDVSGRWVPSVRVEHPPRRDPHARRERAELGVEWLAKRWALEVEPSLPRVRDEGGKLVAA